jgi:hypothetical protein
MRVKVTELTGGDDGATTPASRKRGGRSFGAALSEVHPANTLTSSTGLTTGYAMSRRPVRGLRFRALAAALRWLATPIGGL